MLKIRPFKHRYHHHLLANHPGLLVLHLLALFYHNCRSCIQILCIYESHFGLLNVDISFVLGLLISQIAILSLQQIQVNLSFAFELQSLPLLVWLPFYQL